MLDDEQPREASRTNAAGFADHRARPADQRPAPDQPLPCGRLRSGRSLGPKPADEWSKVYWYITADTMTGHKAALLSDVARAELEAFFGKVIGPWLDAKLEAKARELVERYHDAMDKVFGQYDGTFPRERLLCTREEAAEMLSVSLSTIKRMEDQGHLPEPISVGERGVRHRIVDVEKLARFRGSPMVPSPCGQGPKPEPEPEPD